VSSAAQAAAPLWDDSSNPWERTPAISSDAEASKVSEKRIVSGNFEISSRSILRRTASGLLRKSSPDEHRRIESEAKYLARVSAAKPAYAEAPTTAHRDRD
jgi:hypothetical protein